ncbi:pilus assembly protein [Pseudomonas sp. MAP12]|uniref:Pilus assembly protein n=1 Tax=Geopseudomonas aromaticivorans TaxID=2849492 RepID=A0ABS6N0D8_9GAMM|nr:TadE/TadG family type IV pilus assembly protein [Pseudomonas aromaticivorans]MBV2134514.1 pilus assembly protein [Pseudomonas aromaticivorans]
MNAKRMRGVYVVEFAIIGSLLFVLLFGVLEMGRLYFTVNGLDEVVRRGARLAAVCDIRDARILRRAIFNDINSSGASPLIGSLETADLNLIYLDENGAVVGSPNDLSSANGFRAIRYVQLRVDNFPFELLIPGFRGVFTLPAFRSTIPRESLGRHAEEGVAPEITPC